MPDATYKSNTNRPSGGGLINPGGGFRHDRAGSAAGTDLYYEEEQHAFGGGLRVALESGIPQYRGAFHFTIDATAGDVAFIQGNGTVAQWTLTPSGTISGGTLTLTDSNAYGLTQTTAPIAYNATAAQIQAALEAVLGPNVFCTGGPISTTAVVVNYVGSLGGPHPNVTRNSAAVGLSANTALLTGTTPAIAAATTTTGVLGNTQKIKSIILTTAATAIADGLMAVVRRSTQSVGGTLATATAFTALATAGATGGIFQTDQSDPATGATMGIFTAHATSLGTAVGTAAWRQVVQSALATAPATQVTFDFTDINGKPIALRGASDYLMIWASASLGGSGNLWTLEIVYDEEPGTA